MWKTVLAGGTALAIAGSSFVYAQQRNDAAPSPDVQRQWRPGAQDMGAFIDARVAAIKAGLQLTPDQEKNWPAFEQAYRDLAKLRAERMAARFERRGEDRRDGDRDVNPIDRMGRRAELAHCAGHGSQALRRRSRPALSKPRRGSKASVHVVVPADGPAPPRALRILAHASRGGRGAVNDAGSR